MGLMDGVCGIFRHVLRSAWLFRHLVQGLRTFFVGLLYKFRSIRAIVKGPLRVASAIRRSKGAIAIVGKGVLLIRFCGVNSGFVLVAICLFLYFFRRDLSFYTRVLRGIRNNGRDSIEVLYRFFHYVPTLLGYGYEFLRGATFRSRRVQVYYRLLLLFLPITSDGANGLLRDLSGQGGSGDYHSVRNAIRSHGPNQDHYLYRG